MTTGMKKFTKVCLYTALVMFIIGVIMCGVGWLFGGFRQLNNMDIRGITGIPFAYRVFSNGDYDYGFFSDDDAEWQRAYGNWNRIDDYLGGIGDIEAPALDLTVSAIQDLYIEMGGTLYIKESKDEYVRLAIDGDADKFRYHIDGGNLSIVRRPDWRRWKTDHWYTDDKVYLYLPEGTTFRRIHIEFGAGRIESIGLRTEEADIEIGAGEGIFGSLTAADEAVLSIGAGRIELGNLVCDTANIDVGAGELSIEEAIISADTDIDLGMGSLVIDGFLTKNLDVDCSMGTVSLKLLDSEQDHNYDIDCAMGTVNMGGRSYSGLADEVTIDNGSESDFDIDCSMGTVNITFAGYAKLNMNQSRG